MVDIPPKHISFTRFWRVSLEYRHPGSIFDTAGGTKSILYKKNLSVSADEFPYTGCQSTADERAYDEYPALFESDTAFKKCRTN